MASRPSKAKAHARRFIHHPIAEVVLLVLITVSVVLVPLEQAVSLSEIQRKWLINFGNGLTSVFVVELSIRFWVVRRKRRFFERYWIDLLAVIPFVRPLRMLRVLRIFRAGVLFRRRTQGTFFGGPTSNLTSLAAATLALVLVSTELIYGARHALGASDDTPFHELFWYTVFTMVAGEPIGGEPVTEVGRLVTLALMIGGLTVFGLFVGTISATMIARLTDPRAVHEMDLDELEGHVIIMGWNRSGPTVINELMGEGTPSDRCVVVVSEQAEPEDIPRESVRSHHLYHYTGDYTRIEVLEALNLQSASQVILLTDATVARSDQDRDARTVLAALTIERMCPHIYTVAELTSKQSEPLLRMAGVEEIVVGDWYAGVILGSTNRNRRLVRVLDEILTVGGQMFSTVEVTSAFAGQSVAQLHAHLLAKRRAILVAVSPDEGDVEVNPSGGRTLQQGDRLIVLSDRDVRL